ncbi:hypothetical protein CROQUDRAFT_664362 [Cronartium quercuum f. sp. fusiforme G11]|uniref:CCHC-type domain-containing protein n=1 Tax=Cronartium quercuum f. sp. fusiforme G11 TaxID=708437 RepID=A0A9P6N739_9BASI|nr:hypothetical protein CROQUDRAFT_664362 [Cronartium quercuum f. sp. fusiforme G11]
MTYPRVLHWQNVGTCQPMLASGMGGTNQRRLTLRISDLDHCLCCGQTGHWVRACPYNQPISPNFSNRQLCLNLVDVNGSEFTAEVLPDSNANADEDPLPDGVWASEGNLTEAWDNPDEGADTGVGSNQGT